MPNLIFLPKHYNLVTQDVDVKTYYNNDSSNAYVSDLNLPVEDNIDELACVLNFPNPFELTTLGLKDLPKGVALKLLYLLKNNSSLDFNLLVSIETTCTEIRFSFIVEDLNFHALVEFILDILSSSSHNPSFNPKLDKLFFVNYAFRKEYDKNFQITKTHHYF